MGLRFDFFTKKTWYLGQLWFLLLFFLFFCWLIFLLEVGKHVWARLYLEIQVFYCICSNIIWWETINNFLIVLRLYFKFLYRSIIIRPQNSQKLPLKAPHRQKIHFLINKTKINKIFGCEKLIQKFPYFGINKNIFYRNMIRVVGFHLLCCCLIINFY